VSAQKTGDLLVALHAHDAPVARAAMERDISYAIEYFTEGE
jgi:DNA-binding GntR family transcriptional regulator